jgi:hypothetical protein
MNVGNVLWNILQFLDLHTCKKNSRGKYQLGIPKNTNKTQQGGINEQQQNIAKEY